MSLLVDDFWTEFERRMVPLGWVITEGSRYDPTHIYGISPGGLVWEIHASDNVQGNAGSISIKLGTRTRSINKNRADWESGAQMVDEWIAAYDSLPSGWK